MNKNFVFLSGLPRTGSTLLSVILSQNPDIHSEGNSAVCQMMWDIDTTCRENSNEQLTANHKHDAVDFLISQVPEMYYRNISKKIIVDKSRSWTLPPNVDLIKRMITDNPKFIIMVRPVDEIIKSFTRLYEQNNLMTNYESILSEFTDPIMRSFDGAMYVKTHMPENCIFVDYDELVSGPKETIDKIYDFMSWEPYEHSYEFLVNQNPEDDTVYGLKNQHYVRPFIYKEEYEVTLPTDIVEKCNTLNAALYGD